MKDAECASPDIMSLRVIFPHLFCQVPTDPPHHPHSQPPITHRAVFPPSESPWLVHETSCSNRSCQSWKVAQWVSWSQTSLLRTPLSKKSISYLRPNNEYAKCTGLSHKWRVTADHRLIVLIILVCCNCAWCHHWPEQGGWNTSTVWYYAEFFWTIRGNTAGWGAGSENLPVEVESNSWDNWDWSGALFTACSGGLWASNHHLSRAKSAVCRCWLRMCSLSSLRATRVLFLSLFLSLVRMFPKLLKRCLQEAEFAVIERGCKENF